MDALHKKIGTFIDWNLIDTIYKINVHGCPFYKKIGTFIDWNLIATIHK